MDFNELSEYKKEIDEALKYYNIDNKYKERCYLCLNNLKDNENYLKAFERISNFLNFQDYLKVKDTLKHKSINELFCDGIDPFVTNLIILLSYKTNQECISKYKLDSEQIVINKKRIKEAFESDLINRGYESVRVSQMLWAFNFVRVNIIEIGRLQYQLADNNTIMIHIPRGDKLDIDKVIESINLAKIKIKEIYKLDDITFKCHSWLLSSKLNEIINKESNIHKFYNLFDVEDGDNCHNDLLNFVYQIKDIDDYHNLEENTTLQRIIKKELLQGAIFKIGDGILKK